MSNKLSKEGGSGESTAANNETDLIVSVIYLDRRGEGSEQSASSIKRKHKRTDS